TTDGSGVATATSWTLGTTVRTDTARATASGLAGSPVIFTATATAGTAATIAANSPTSQPGTAGAAVSSPPSVIVKDANGNPVSGVAVTFSATGANGTVNPATPVTTDGSGVATATSWTLGTTVRTDTARATASGLAGSPVIFTATATAGTAATIAANSPTSQPGTAGAAVSSPPSVIVKDANGNPVSGVAVTFSATGANGTVNPATPVTTDGSGVATATSWTLGTTVRTDTARATASGLAGSPVIFTATATAGTAATIAANSPTSQPGTAGAAVASPPSVLVKDANGNPVSGVAVTFSATGANGTVNPATPVTTDGSGVATATSWTLGTTVRTDTARATASGLAGSPVIFTATATAGTAATIAANSPTSQPGTAGAAVGSPPSVLVKDANGNPVAGV